MLCTKEKKTWERLIRVLAGVAFLILVYLSWVLSDAGAIAGAIGLMLLVLVLFGGCPVCTIVRKRNDKGD